MLVASFNFGNRLEIFICGFVLSALLALPAAAWGASYAHGLIRKVIVLIASLFLALGMFLLAHSVLTTDLQWPRKDSENRFEIGAAVGIIGLATGLTALGTSIVFGKLGGKKKVGAGQESKS